MTGIYLAAAVTTVTAGGLIGGMLIGRCPKEERLRLATAVLLILPMSWLAFHLVRTPYDNWLSTRIADKMTLGFVKTFDAPLTEEPAKMWPLLLPFAWWRRSDDRRWNVRLAIALGLGFGIGEAWMLAQLIADKDPKIAALPWYQLTGFINERSLVCIAHAAFTACVTRFGIARGLPLAMLLHWIGNFPIFLAHYFQLAPSESSTILSIWVTLYILSCGALLAKFYVEHWQLGEALFGRITCPDCQQEYARPLFGLNLGTKRYEPCPHCKKWHLL